MDACSVAARAYDLSSQSIESHSLLDVVTRELQAIDNYEQDMRFVKSTLAQYRNSAFAISPINALPCEVLEHVFTLLSRSHSCLAHGRRDGDVTESGGEDGNTLDYKTRVLIMPEVMSRVCSRWRRIVLGMRDLWAHVDIFTSDQWCTKLISRSKFFASKSPSPWLEVHVSNPYCNSVVLSSVFQSELKLASAVIAPKIRSFRLDDLSYNQDEFTHLINYFLRHITPGALTRLILLDHSPIIKGRIDVIDPNGPEDEVHPWLTKRPPPLWMSMRALDEILYSVKVLWLKNQYFPWDSQAYSGLVDLRLLSHGMTWGHLIKISELVGILGSCPELRIFHCGLDIDTQLHGTESISRVPLKDLEVLKLHVMFHDHSLSLLDYLYPGTKPLNLSIRVGRQKVLENIPLQLLDFFDRTNIERLFFTGYNTMKVRPDRIFPALPIGLRTLGFNGFRLVQWCSEFPQPDQGRWTGLNTLILDRSTSDIATLHRLVTACSVRILVLDSYDIYSGGGVQVDEEAKQTIPIISKSSKEYGVDGNGWMSS